MILFLMLFLFFLPLEATEIEANKAEYDGDKIRLTGNVHIEHDFGEIHCDRGVMLMAKGQKRYAPERILLNDNVHVKLKDGSILTSEEADIDCQTLVGLFTAKAPQKVEYLTLMLEGDKTFPVKATSRAMRVMMKKQEIPKSEYVIQDVQAEGAVNIEYQNEL